MRRKDTNPPKTRLFSRSFPTFLSHLRVSGSQRCVGDHELGRLIPLRVQPRIERVAFDRRVLR